MMGAISPAGEIAPIVVGSVRLVGVLGEVLIQYLVPVHDHLLQGRRDTYYWGQNVCVLLIHRV